MPRGLPRGTSDRSRRGWGPGASGKKMTRTLVLLLAIQLVSVSDEIAIGRQAQAEIKRQTPELTDSAFTSYVSRVGRQLAAHAHGAKYPYSFSVANYREINAFA